MKTYRIWFLDWTTANYFETGEPLRYRDYTARSATQAYFDDAGTGEEVGKVFVKYHTDNQAITADF